MAKKLLKKKMKPNYLLNQYKKDNKLKISHNYLKEQFFDYSKIFVDIKSEEMVTAEINYTKIKFNKTSSISFIIPKSYVPIN